MRCALLVVVCRLLIVDCCPLFIVGCMLLVSCCWLLLAAHLDFKTTELYCESTHGCLTMAHIIPQHIMANKTQSRTRKPCPSISIPHVVVTLHMLSLGLLDQYSFSHDVFVLVVCFAQLMVACTSVMASSTHRVATLHMLLFGLFDQ